MKTFTVSIIKVNHDRLDLRPCLSVVGLKSIIILPVDNYCHLKKQNAYKCIVYGLGVHVVQVKGGTTQECEPYSETHHHTVPVFKPCDCICDGPLDVKWQHLLDHQRANCDRTYRGSTKGWNQFTWLKMSFLNWHANVCHSITLLSIKNITTTHNVSNYLFFFPGLYS